MELKVIVKTVGESPKVKVFEGKSNNEIVTKFINGWLEGVPFGNNIIMWVDEEGKLKNLERNIFIVRSGSVIDNVVGNIIFTSVNDEGEITSLSDMQIDYLNKIIKHFYSTTNQLQYYYEVR